MLTFNIIYIYTYNIYIIIITIHILYVFQLLYIYICARSEDYSSQVRISVKKPAALSP